MVEVLFGASEAGSMKMVKNRAISNKVVGLEFMLDIGSIDQEPKSESRRMIMCSMNMEEQWNRSVSELAKFKEYIAQDEELRIWYSKTPYSLCGLYYVCSLLEEYQGKVVLVELPEFQSKGETIIRYQNWGEVIPEELALVSKNQYEIGPLQIDIYSKMWQELVQDNSPLRTVINSRLIGVQEDFYDFLIWNVLKESPMKEIGVIGDIIGYYQLSVWDGWFANRIQYYIDQGAIEILEDSANPYARLIRRNEREDIK